MALSSDGKTAIVGGPGSFDFVNGGTGAAWIFATGLSSFSAAADGFPVPTVQWQVSTNGGGTFADIPGATSASLNVAPVPASSGNRYRAVFTNSQGTATTTAATFMVDTPPSVTTQPADQILTAGQTAHFTAAATGSPAPSVQWQVKQAPGDFVDLAGATSPTLTFTATAAMLGNSYRAVFRNGCGTATTAAALLGTQAVLTTAASPLAGGSVTFSSGGSYTPGAVVNLQASPAPGYVFVGWSGPVASATSASTTLTVSQSMSVTATFAPTGTETQAIPTLDGAGLALLAGLLAFGGLWLLAFRGGTGA